jgi:hypothetical protein
MKLADITRLDTSRTQPHNGAQPVAAPRLTNSPYAIDHRSELIRELRNDADILDQQAAEISQRAHALRLSAEHLESHPPDQP